MRSCSLVSGALACVLLFPIPIGAAPVDPAAALLSGFSAGGEQATFSVQAGEYQLTSGAKGERIEVEHFGTLLTPGKPRLPVRRFLIALPPGARAISVEVLRARTTVIPGSHQIEPSAQVYPLMTPEDLARAMARMKLEWQTNHDASYTSDGPYPAEIAWLDGAGTLRKYSYASVSFAPVTYHPLSGTLEYHRDVDVAIHYELPDTPSDEQGALRLDTAADEEAARLFCNLADVAADYSPGGSGPTPRSVLHDYVIITTPQNLEGVTASGFVSWKSSLGHDPRIVLTTDSEIAAQPGADLAARIRNFLRSSYIPWGIEYVLLVGNYLAVPMRICYPDPAFHVYDPDNPGLVAPGTPTDYYYADLSFADSLSWDSDGDGFPGEHLEDTPDFLAEIAVGRIPVNNNSRITYALDKIVDYEQDPGSWKNSALHAGSILFFENQNHNGGPFVDGAALLDSIATGLMSGWPIHCMSEQEGLVVSSFPWAPISETAFADAWRTGQYGFVNWSGHGWCDGAARTVWEWDDGDGVPESGGPNELSSHYFIRDLLTNLDDDYPSIVFAVSCNVGYPEPNSWGRAGVDLMTSPSWGAAVGIVSSTRPAAVSGDWVNDPGGAEQISYDFNRFMISERKRLGDAIYEGKFHSHTAYGWDSVYETMNMYNFNLYGDPAMQAGSVATGVAEIAPVEGGDGLRLRSLEPNPFSATTSIRFTVVGESSPKISAFDIHGRRVAGLTCVGHGRGEFTATWDGRDRAGRSVASGLYFLVVESGSVTLVQKVVLLR